MAACLAGLLVLLWLVHRVAFPAPFYFDTVYHLEGSSHLHMTEVSGRSLWVAVHLGHGGQFYRPLSNLSLAFTHRFWGLTPAAYRMGNLVIHWFGALALWFLFLSVQATPKVRAAGASEGWRNWAVPVLAATLWALHPIQTNVVAYVIQRMASLSGLFTFLAVGAYLRARSASGGWSWSWAGVSIVSAALALASKENALVLVPLVGAAEWVLLEPWRSGRARTVAIWFAVALAACGLAVLVWKGPWLWHHLGTISDHRSFTPWERLLTQARLQAPYLLVLLIPDPRLLTLNSEAEVSRGFLDPPSTAASVAAVVLAVGLVAGMRRRRPVLSFGILWFLLAQLVEGTLLPLELYYEHRMYVPSAFLFYAAAWGIAFLPGAGRFRLRVAVGIAASLLAVLSWATHQRSLVWANPLSFWGDAVLKAPGNSRAYTNLCRELIAADRHADARLVCGQALELGGDPVVIRVNLATLAQREGDLQGAFDQLSLALEAPEPTDVRGSKWKARRGLATLLIGQGRLDEAEEHLVRASEEHTGDPEVWSLLGAVALLRGELDLAEERLRQALRYGPSHGRAWNNLGAVYFQRERYGEALSAFEKAIRYAPEDKEAAANLSKAREAFAGNP